MLCMPLLTGAVLDRLQRVLSRIDTGADLGEVLTAITDGVVEVSGFATAAVSVPYGRLEMEVVAVSGAEPGLEDLVGQRFPRSDLERHWRTGAPQGRFVFVPHHHHDSVADEPGVLVPDLTPVDDPRAWQPLDELNAPLRTPGGELLGALGVDRPRDGLRPSPETMSVLEIFAMQASVAISQAVRREELREEVLLSNVVNNVFALTSEGSLDDVLERALPTITEDMAASDLVVGLPDPTGSSAGVGWLVGGSTAPHLADQLSGLGSTLAEHAHRTDDAVVLTPAMLDAAPGDPVLGGLDEWLAPQHRRDLAEAMRADHVTRVVVAPLTQGRSVIGHLVLVRTGERLWTSTEQAASLDIGRALSWAVERDRALQEVARARSEVAAQRRENAAVLRSLAHRVGESVGAVDEHLRARRLPVAHPARRAMTSFWALAAQVVTLSGFQAHPARARSRPVDLEAMVATVWAGVGRGPDSVGRQVRLLPLAVGGDVRVTGDPDQLEWLLRAMCEELVRDTADGGAARLSLTRRGDRVLVSGQSSGRSSVTSDPDEAAQPDRVESWWAFGARALLGRTGSRLLSRQGPVGRQAVTLDLPAARP